MIFEFALLLLQVVLPSQIHSAQRAFPPQNGLVRIAVPRAHFSHACVWLNGRELKRGGWGLPEGDFIPTGTGIIPCRSVYAEWVAPNAEIVVQF